MNTAKRGRGRPLGTGKDDSRFLESVADVLATNPSLRPTTAAKRVNANASEADIRRFQVKWREQRDELLEAARFRAEAAQSAKDTTDRQSHRRYGHGSRASLPQMDSMLRLARVIEEMENNSLTRMVRAMEDNSVTRLARAMEDNPVIRLARAMEDNSVTRLARAMENNSVTRLARGLQDSRTIGLAQEIAKRPGRGR